MMDLTPLDVRKKSDDFKRAVRGYEQAQVDAFLDLCADRLEQLMQRDARLQAEVTGLRERVGAYEEREKALNEALVTAQELREEARSQAERSAELKLREAEQDAARILQEADAATEQARRALEELHVKRAGYLRSLRWSVERFLGEIEEEESRLERSDSALPTEAGSRDTTPSEPVPDENSKPAEQGTAGS